MNDDGPKGSRWGVALHGGAGVKAGRNYARAEAEMARLVVRGASMLVEGEAALDVVEILTAEMEASGLFVAGRGSAKNDSGQVELDASLMNGRDRQAGAVAALRGYVSPIALARRVLRSGDTVFVAGDGAKEMARDQHLEQIRDLDAWLTDPDGFDAKDLPSGHGTVGAVALDRSGGLAAATSTGGTYGSRPGRVGDSAMIGAGTWADDLVAVSCTGEGEAFIRAAAAYDLAARIRYANLSLDAAAKSVLATVEALGGDGGLIVITAAGDILMPFNTPGMKRASASHATPAVVGSVGRAMRRVDDVPSTI